MTEKKTYIELMKIIDEALPFHKELNYSQISEHKLWLRIYKCLEDCGCDMLKFKDELSDLRYDVMGYQSKMYENYVFGSLNDVFHTKNILETKRRMLQLIYDSYKLNDSNYCVSIEQYDEFMGSTSEIKELITEENVRKNIVRLFDNLLELTKGIDLLKLPSFRIAEIISDYYNFNVDDFIYSFVNDITVKYSKFADIDGTISEENRKNFYMYIKNNLDSLVNYIVEKCNILFEKRTIKTDIIQLEDKNIKNSGVEVVGGAENDYLQDEKKSGSQQSIVNLDVMMSNYYRMLEIMEKNDAIIKELVELRKKIAELEEELVANNSLLGDLRGPRKS